MSHNDYDGIPTELTRGHAGPVYVVGVDGSPASGAALRYAVDKAHHGNGEVHALYAYAAVGTVGERDQCEQRARSFVREALERLPEAARTVPLLVTASPGDAARLLVEAARSTDGLVLGGSPTASAAHPLGETAHACVVDGGSPVTVVPESWSPVSVRREPTSVHVSG